MKKVYVFLIFIGLFFGKISSAFASEVSWEDITNAIQKDTETSTYTSVADDTHLTFTYTEGESSYVSTFTYSEGIIKLEPRDTTNLSDEEMVTYALVDSVGVFNVMSTVSALNDVDVTLLEEEKQEMYGIVFETEEVSYSKDAEEDGSSISMTVTYVKTFTLNLDQFEEGTADLRGTYHEESEGITILENPTLAVSLENAYDTSIELAIQVSNLSLLQNANAVCKIYAMPAVGGESQLIGTMNCNEVKNIYTVSNLEPNTSYSFAVQLHYDWSVNELELSNIVYGDWVEFSTKESELTNPKTGMGFIYIVIIMCALSVITVLLTYQKINRENAI